MSCIVHRMRVSRAEERGGGSVLSEQEFDEYCAHHHLSAEAVAYIQQVRHSAPSRRVGTHARTNVCTDFPSKKMGVTIQAESRTGEFGFVVECEGDDNTVEYYDQPPPVPIEITDVRGVVKEILYTSDYLQLTNNGPLVVEIKLEDSIAQLVTKRPNDWILSEDGVVYKPAADRFAELGLRHVVVIRSKDDQLRTANNKLLLLARNCRMAGYDHLLEEKNEAFQRSAWMRLSDLADRLGIVDKTPLLRMINEGDLFASVDYGLLIDPRSIWVANSEDMLALCIEQGISQPHAIDVINLDTAVDVSAVPTEKYASGVLNKLQKLTENVSTRSTRRWLKRIKEGEQKGLTVYESLLDLRYKSGNRKPRLHPACIDYLVKFIKTRHATSKRTPKKKSFALYRELAPQVHPGIEPACRTTFNKYVARLAKAVARGRGGVRAENAATRPSPPDSRELRATMAWELATLDHCQAKIECVVVRSNGKIYTAKPWISALVDINTKAVLAYWITFRAPSKRSCAMVIRQCVRRHGRLPLEIIVDRGSDFESTYFSTLLAQCEVSHLRRPTAHPRYGAEVERAHGEFKSQWLSSRPGNLAERVEARAVSSTHTAANMAELELSDLMREFGQFVDWRNSSLVGCAFSSANDMMDDALRNYSCLGKLQNETPEFVIATAVDTKEYKIDPVRGIHIEFHYWHPELSRLRGVKSHTEVRIEPEDPYRIYAWVVDHWVVCMATGANRFMAKDPIDRLADAIKLLDGKALRNTAKDEAEQLLIRNLIEADSQLSAKRVLEMDSDAPAQASPPHTKSLFDAVSKGVHAELEVSEWKDK